MKYFKKIPKKTICRKKKIRFNPNLILLAERPTEKIIKKIGYALFNEKTDSKMNLLKKLEKEKIFLFFIMEHTCFSKNNRIIDIKTAYTRIKPNICTKKVIILHNYVEEAIGNKLRKDFPKVKILTLNYIRSHDEFKKKLLRLIRK